MRHIPLFCPHVPDSAIEAVAATLRTRWIGQGPKVDEFENRFQNRFELCNHAVAVNSCTAALHLAYVLAGISPGDEVICPIFTCTATATPLLQQGATIRFADVQPNTLNISPSHVRELLTEKTKAIVCVHYGGLPCDMLELRDIAAEAHVPLIADAAQALGASYHETPVGSWSDYTCYSFQAIKHITTADGGMLSVPHSRLAEAKRRRWFGIDRQKKLDGKTGTWDTDITELGYKYQMTDVAASMGLAALDTFNDTLGLRQQLFHAYENGLAGMPDTTVLGGNSRDRQHAAWMMTVRTPRSANITRKLLEHGVESGPVHYRLDRYSLFGGRQTCFPNMDAIENEYLVLPLHTHMDIADIEEICHIIKGG